MTNKITLNDLAAQMQKGFTSVNSRIHKLETLIEKGFAATADDIADIKRDMATKDQVIALHTQVNSVEAQLRQGRYETRLGNIEEKVFGAPRA